MIKIDSECDIAPTTWQQGFLEILPEIQARLRRAFCRLGPDAREEATEDGIVHCLLAYIRLFDQGRVQQITASNLSWYATLHVRRGRETACRLNAREPLSRYAQLGAGTKTMRPKRLDTVHGDWIDLLLTDRRSSVFDQVAARMDLRAWLNTLSRQVGKIARDLAHGYSTEEVARKNGVSASRISQLRRSLKTSWQVFQGECTFVASW